MINFRGRYGRARVHVADETLHFSIHQFLCDQGCLTGFAAIIFRLHDKFNFLTAYADAFGIGLVDGHAHAVFGVLA